MAGCSRAYEGAAGARQRDGRPEKVRGMAGRPPALPGAAVVVEVNRGGRGRDPAQEVRHQAHSAGAAARPVAGHSTVIISKIISDFISTKHGSRQMTCDREVRPPIPAAGMQATARMQATAGSRRVPGAARSPREPGQRGADQPRPRVLTASPDGAQRAVAAIGAARPVSSRVCSAVTANLANRRARAVRLVPAG